MNTRFVGPALASALLAAVAATTLAQGNPGSSLTEKDMAPPTPVSTAPPSSERPGEMPPRPPTVTCGRGELTIIADNSTLGSILSAVQLCIDVRFDVPADSREMRTFIHLGPGPTPAVLRSLLESTDDDFVIEPSASDPQAIQSVILIARAKTDDRGEPTIESRTLTAARRAWLEERRMTRTPPPPDDDSGDPSAAVSDDGQSVAENPASPAPAGADNAGAAQSAAAPPPAASPAAAPVADASNNANSGDANGQLPDQITSMQQLFQQRAQMVQGQAKPQSPAPSPAPQ